MRIGALLIASGRDVSLSLILPLVVCQAAPEERRPTRVDLDETIAAWNRIAAPGTILTTQGGATLCLSSDLQIKAIMDAQKIGDDNDTILEFIQSGQAFIEHSVVDVRVLGAFNRICLSFRGLGMPCKDMPETLAGLYHDVENQDNKRRLRVPGITAEEERKKDGQTQSPIRHA